MIFTTVTLSGVLKDALNAPIASSQIKAEIINSDIGIGGDGIVYPREEVVIDTDGNGAFSKDLITLAGSFLNYKFTLPNGKKFKASIGDVGTIDFDTLLNSALLSQTPITSALNALIDSKINTAIASVAPLRAYKGFPSITNVNSHTTPVLVSNLSIAVVAGKAYDLNILIPIVDGGDGIFISFADPNIIAQGTRLTLEQYDGANVYSYPEILDGSHVIEGLGIAVRISGVALIAQNGNLEFNIIKGGFLSGTPSSVMWGAKITAIEMPIS